MCNAIAGHTLQQSLNVPIPPLPCHSLLLGGCLWALTTRAPLKLDTGTALLAATNKPQKIQKHTKKEPEIHTLHTKTKKPFVCDSLLWEAACGDDWVCGHEGGQVCLDADRSHAGAASSVWDAEGLVQVQVAHVCTNVAGAGQANLSERGSKQ
jgi:hypothetical protein